MSWSTVAEKGAEAAAESPSFVAEKAGTTAGTMEAIGDTFGMPGAGQMLDKFSKGGSMKASDMIKSGKFGNNPETYGYATRQLMENAPPVRSQPAQQQEQPTRGFGISRRYRGY